VYGFDQLLLTIEMKINYLEPIPAGEVVAEAYVLRSSRRSAYAEVDIWSQGKLARARQHHLHDQTLPPNRGGLERPDDGRTSSSSAAASAGSAPRARCGARRCT
jgi:hypothetical protein